MRILVKKVIAFLLCVPLGFAIFVGAFLGMCCQAFMWGFKELSEEVLDKLGEWRNE